MKQIAVFCLATLLFACYSYGPTRQGYSRPSSGGWYLPTHRIGNHHLQMTLMSVRPDSSTTPVTYGTIECLLEDTLASDLSIRNLEVTSLRVIVDTGDTIDAALTHYDATSAKREDGTFAGPRFDIGPFALPVSTSHIITALTVLIPGASADGRDSSITFTEQLQSAESGLLTHWVTLEAYPNPFSPSNTIEYVIPGKDSAYVTIDLYSVTGKKVAVLVNGYQSIGRHEITPDFTGYASGIYFYKLTVGTFTATRKFALIK